MRHHTQRIRALESQMALSLEHWCLAPVATRGIDLVTAFRTSITVDVLPGTGAERALKWLQPASRTDYQNRQQICQKAIDRIGLVLSVRRSQERQNTTSGGAL